MSTESTERYVCETVRVYLAIEERVKDQRKLLNEELKRAKDEMMAAVETLGQGELFNKRGEEAVDVT